MDANSSQFSSPLLSQPPLLPAPQPSSHLVKYVQIDWGGEYHKLHQFIQNIGFYHMLICP